MAAMTSDLTFENTCRIVETDDYRIQINEAGSGHPVFMVHGSGPGATGWSNFAPNLKGLSGKFRCIAVTMPGWGESTPQSVDTGRDPVKALVQLMDALGVDRGAFVGNSMGGAISTQMTVAHPARVSHLVIMGSGLPGIPILSSARTEGMTTLINAYVDTTRENIKKLVEVMCYDPAFAADELIDQRTNAAIRFPEHNKNFMDIWNSGTVFAGMEGIAARLSHTTVPALIIHGRDDRVVSLESSLRTVGTIPNSRMVIFNHCGHWAQLEHADEFNRLVDDFVSHN